MSLVHACEVECMYGSREWTNRWWPVWDILFFMEIYLVLVKK